MDSGLHKRFDVVDAQGQVLQHIRGDDSVDWSIPLADRRERKSNNSGPLFESRLWTEDIDFDVYDSSRKEKVGKLVLKYPGMKKEVLNAEEFHIKFPESSSAECKLLLTSATVLIHAMCCQSK